MQSAPTDQSEETPQYRDDITSELAARLMARNDPLCREAAERLSKLDLALFEIESFATEQEEPGAWASNTAYFARRT